jgi:hypothetical protein
MSTEILVVVGIVIALGFFVWWFRFRKKKLKPSANHPVPIPERFNHQYTRPDGGHVVSMYPIPAEIRTEVMGRIVSGLQRTIDAARAVYPSWQNYTRTQDFDIVHLIEPMATNQDGSPALMVRGVYQSAGTVLNVHLPGGMWGGPPYLILPDQGHPSYSWGYLDYFESSVRHEAEHAIEWMNDKAVFYSKAGGGDIHPHFPEVGGSRPVGFMSNAERANCIRGVDERTFDVYITRLRVADSD